MVRCFCPLLIFSVSLLRIGKSKDYLGGIKVIAKKMSTGQQPFQNGMFCASGPKGQAMGGVCTERCFFFTRENGEIPIPILKRTNCDGATDVFS